MLLGIVIYLFCRDIKSTNDVSNLDRFYLFILPDAIWSFSLVVFICIVWLTPQSSAFFGGLACVAIGISFEIGQYFKIFNGTYDHLDLFASVIASILAFIISQYIINRLNS